LTKLVEIFEDVTSRDDQGEPVDVVYLDFQTAFDQAPQNRLLCKVKLYGIAGNILRRRESWLADRKQSVVINESFSDWQAVISGVQQGSVLRPQLSYYVLMIWTRELNVLSPNI